MTICSNNQHLRRVEATPGHVAYVLKRYPRLSETFIVNEILAHERAGLQVSIFSLRTSNESHFHEMIGRVRAPITYLDRPRLRLSEFWSRFDAALEACPKLHELLADTPRPAPSEIHQAIELAEMVTSRGITHIHAHFATTAAMVARWASHLSGVPYSITAHAKDIFHESVSPDDLRSKLSDAKSVVTVSDFNLAYLRREYGDAANRVVRVYNGLNLPEFSYHAPDTREPLIIAVGRLVEKKGFCHLIDACAVLRDKGEQFQCVLVGGGELELSLKNQIKELDLNNIVTLTGSLSQEMVRCWIHRASLMAAPCIIGDDGNRDGMPTVLLEAMALGTPCVSTDVTGIPEIIRHGETGLIVAQGDAKELASAMSTMLQDADMRVRLASAARAVIETSFSIDSNTQALRDIFALSSQRCSTEAHAGVV